MTSKNWTPEEIQAVWEKGSIIQGANENVWRKDAWSAWILRFAYGDRNSDYGWEIDHIDGNPENGELSNLRPLQWSNNDSGECVVTSSGNKNVRCSDKNREQASYVLANSA